MTLASLRKGWCPGALRPMASGDGLVVRVRAHAGRLPLQSVIAIAEAAEAFGNGKLDITQRASLQIRGVTEASHDALIDRLDALGLIDADIGSEAIRNIVVDP
ncbi:MAG: precorrin-3B synthase, partial [Hyphomicrobiales bacterium]|nr:precorrin-3B synthase [Hyphomicrobiales bacterium]